MADIANKYPENVAGKYYVDNQCIDCDLCRETAPDNFKRNEDGGYSFVYKQPESPEEEARCKEAKEGCPVEAIGDKVAVIVNIRNRGKLPIPWLIVEDSVPKEALLQRPQAHLSQRQAGGGRGGNRLEGWA